jgi:hypothetical protein
MDIFLCLDSALPVYCLGYDARRSRLYAGFNKRVRIFGVDAEGARRAVARAAAREGKTGAAADVPVRAG